MPRGILVFSLPIARVRCGGPTRAGPKILTSPVAGVEFTARSVAVMTGPEGFACGGRVVIAVSFGPKVNKSFLAVLTGFDHSLLARPCAWPRSVTRHV